MIELDKIHLGDSYELIKHIPDKSIDLVLIDPPYNIGVAEWDRIDNYVEWMGGFFQEFNRVLKDNGSMYFWHSDMNQASQLMEWLRVNTEFIFNSFIVWDKNEWRAQSWKNNAEDNNLRSWFNTAEYCFYYTLQEVDGGRRFRDAVASPIREYLRNAIIKKDGKLDFYKIANIFGHGDCVAHVSNLLSYTSKNVTFVSERNYKMLQAEYEDLRREYEDLRREYEDLRFKHNLDKEHNNVWRLNTINAQSGRDHICEKPLNFMSRIIKCSTNEGDTVLDCFSGSGTTCVAAKELNRHFIGIEIDPHYHKISVDRLNGISSNGQTSIFTNFEAIQESIAP